MLQTTWRCFRTTSSAMYIRNPIHSENLKSIRYQEVWIMQNSFHISPLFSMVRTCKLWRKFHHRKIFRIENQVRSLFKYIFNAQRLLYSLTIVLIIGILHEHFLSSSWRLTRFKFMISIFYTVYTMSELNLKSCLEILSQ